MSEVSLEIKGETVCVRRDGDAVVEAPLAEVVRRIRSSGDLAPSCGILPDGLRFWLQRGDAVALAIEVRPHARSVRWLAESSKVPFGEGAVYETRFVAFPYVVILAVLRSGALTGLQQLYFRTRPLADDDALLLPNLYNVAKTPIVRCWLCLAEAPDVSERPWPQKVALIVDHVFAGAFNRSSEIHEGNSYWSRRRPIDPRYASVAEWERASRANPRFPLDVAWKPAGTTMRDELAAMLAMVTPERGLDDVGKLATLVTAATRRGRSEGLFEF